MADPYWARPVGSVVADNPEDRDPKVPEQAKAGLGLHQHPRHGPTARSGATEPDGPELYRESSLTQS